MVQWNRAQTIHAAPTQIWPWLVQMGCGRGGWYTNAKLDRLIWRIDAVNADAILAPVQHLADGAMSPEEMGSKEVGVPRGYWGF